MQTQVQVAQVKGQDKVSKKVLAVNLPVAAYHEVPVPGFKGATIGACFVKVTDLPPELESFLGVNPRAPKKTAGGKLTGPIVADIRQTLLEAPEEMALKNRGLFILAENIKHSDGSLKFVLSDKGKHGLVDGGHTACTIWEARITDDEGEQQALDRAYVRVHIVQGLKADQVVEIASGLNTSRAVDDASLMNLQGDFDLIRRTLRGTEAENSIAYMQGDEGAVYVSELLVYLSALDSKRFTGESQPAGLYSRKSTALRYFAEDLQNEPKDLQARVDKLPDILRLVDGIRMAIPEAARKGGFKLGMAIVGGDRLGSKAQRGKVLPFTGRISNYKIPQGWVMPVLSAFRVALKPTKEGLKWRANPELILKETIDELVGILIAAHKATGGHADKIGKSEAVYAACQGKVELWLAKKRLLS